MAEKIDVKKLFNKIYTNKNNNQKSATFSSKVMKDYGINEEDILNSKIEIKFKKFKNGNR